MNLRRARVGGTMVLLGLLMLHLQATTGVAWAGRADSEALLRKGQRAIQSGHFTDAIIPLERACDLDPGYDVPKSQLADLWEVFQKYNDAARLMQSCVRIRPGYADYWYRLGKYLYLSTPSQPDQAISALKRSLAIQPRNHKALYILAQIQYKKSDLAGAEKTFQQAVAIDSGNLTYKYWLGRIHYETGRSAQAERELSTLMVKLKVTKQPPYQQVQGLLTRIQHEQSTARLRRILVIVVPGVLIVVVGVVGFLAMRGKRGGSDRMDLPADAGTYEEIAAMALRRLCTMTQMTYGLMYVANIDGNELVPKATVVIDTEELKPIAMDTTELPRWIERNDGKPFLFNVEKKEGVFIKAFPDARDLLEPMEIRIGVPFIFQERMLGIAFLGVEKTKDILKLKKLYERSQMDIYRMSVEVASALFRVYESELAYVDLTTKFRSRKYVEENLPRALVGAEDSGRKGVVVVFEYDQYRTLEEQYGDGQADQVLRMIADELRNVVPPDEGILARFEGGRFFAFMPVYTADQARAAADKIHDRVGQTRISRNLPPPTASVGAAVFPEQGRKADDLIWAAERVMMGIYASGGNQVGMVEGEKEGGPRLIEAPLPPGAPGAAAPMLPSRPISPAGSESEPASGPPRVPGFSGAGGFGPRARPPEEKGPGAGQEGPRPFQKPPGSTQEGPRPLQKPPGSTQEGARPFLPGFSGGPRPPARPAYIPPTTPASSEPPAPSPAGSEEAGERRVASPGRVPSWMKTGGDGAAAPPPPRPVAAPPPPRPVAAPPPASSSDTAPPPPVARPRPPGGVPGFSGGTLNPPTRPEPSKPATASSGAAEQSPGLDLTTTPTGKTAWSVPVSPPARPAEVPAAPDDGEATAGPGGTRAARGLLSRPGGGRSLFGRKASDTDAGNSVEPAAATSGASSPALPTAPVLPPLSSMGAAAGARTAPPPPTVDYPRDELTGFVASSHVEEAIARAVDHAYEAQEPCSLLFFSLDKYEAIQNLVGAEKTDNVVREVTSLINDFLKEGTDVPGRWGDDGFTVVLPRTSSRIACNLAQQICFTVGNLTFPGIESNTTLSLGIASYPEQAHSPQELLRYAQEAAQKAQEGGGNTMHVYGAADTPSSP